jgi:hypothetical protein
MKSLSIVVTAFVALISGAVFAQSDMPVPKKDQIMNAVSNKTSAEARADTVAFLAMGGAAQQNGEYRLVSALPTTQVSREQVGAECTEAMRLGLLKDGHTTIFATPAQMELIRAAGLRAVQKATMVK